jgi:dual specificity protein kinase YAK1
MANRTAFIDFAQGLLNLNPLERWTPAQARLHPFITQAKYTGPFIPPMSLRQGSNKTPAPGVQEQQRAETLSKQRAQQAAQAQAQQTAAYQNMQMSPGYPQTPQTMQTPGVYNNMYGPNHAGAPPPYQQQPAPYPNPQMPMMPQSSQAPRYNAQPQPNLYAQATTRAGRQRASTMDQQQPSGIPPSIQRVISHLDPNAPIRLQPSPAYYPPPPDGSDTNSRRRSSRTGGRRDFIRNLEDRTLEEGFMSQNHHWQ